MRPSGHPALRGSLSDFRINYASLVYLILCILLILSNGTSAWVCVRLRLKIDRQALGLL